MARSMSGTVTPTWLRASGVVIPPSRGAAAEDGSIGSAMPRARAGLRIHRRGEQDQRARQPILPGGAEAEKARGAADFLDEDDARERAEERAAAAEDAGSAEHHGRDALQRVVLPDGRIADADLTGEQQPACGREERAQHV